MMPFFTNRPLKKDKTPCWFAGLHVTACCRRLEAALIGIHGYGTDCLVEIGHGLAIDLPPEFRLDIETAAHQDRDNAHGKKGHGKGLSQHGRDAAPFLQTCAAENVLQAPSLKTRAALLAIQEETIRELLTSGGVAPSELLAIGVHDPGLWSADIPADTFPETYNDKDVDSSPRIGDISYSRKKFRDNKPGSTFYAPLSDTAGLAARTGHNVLEALPVTDLSTGGQGGPLFPLAYWAILHSNERHRLLLDLGQDTRITFLPNSLHGNKSQIGYGFAGACGSLIDPIVQALTSNEQKHDDGGRLSVQGTLLPELQESLARWGEQNASTLPLHWSPFSGVFGAEQAKSILEAARRKNWPLRDVLCTVVEAIACRIARALRVQFGPILAGSEVLLAGGGRRHGDLVRKLKRELAGTKFLPLESLKVNPETLDASALAVLTSLTINQVPGNLPHLTGAETDRVLGRLIPGSPQNWQKLIRAMSEAQPTMRTLRGTF